MDNAREFAIGDINSQEKGSAARSNAGKPIWSFMPLSQIANMMRRFAISDRLEEQNALAKLTEALAYFQEAGTKDTAFYVLESGIRYLMQATDTDMDGALCQVIKVWELGEKKYAKFNWMKGMVWTETLNSAQRHVMQMYKGEQFDDDSQQHHAAHFICNAMMMVHYVDHFPEGNDLPVAWFSP